MIKEIKYNGYSANPSDYECADGDLATTMGLIQEDGAMKPLMPPTVICSYQSNERIIYIHKTAVFTHYIKLSDDYHDLFWIDSTDMSEQFFLSGFSSTVYKINSVGNTLCVLCEDGLHYLLWKNADSSYKYLGQKPPYVLLQFGLSANYKASYDRGTIETTDTSKTYEAAWRMMDYEATDCLEINSEKTAVSFKSAHLSDMQTSIWALINQTNALITKEGHFYAPFLVRYCYRFYDGTMWMHSAPVLMPVAMPFSYQVEIPNVFSNITNNNIDRIVNDMNVLEEGGDGKDFKLTKLGFRYRPHNVALQCKVINSALSSLKKDWGDIVKSIDIFVSLPLVREDNSETIKTASRANVSYHLRAGYLSQHSYTWYLNGDENIRNDVICDIPLFSEEAYLDKIRSVGNFYKVHSYNLETDTIPSTMTEVPLNKSALPVLATQEVMTDDYKSHNRLLPSFTENGSCATFLYIYNGRLNVSGVREELFGGFAIQGLLPYCHSGSFSLASIQHIYVYLTTEDGECVVDCYDEFKLSPTSVVDAILYNLPIFYPDSRATRMEVLANSVLYVLKMEAHPTLNGATTIGGIMSSLAVSFNTKSYTAPTISKIVEITNKIYTSEVNNPFYFPVLGINTVGTGNILGICAAAKALSEGQFGQFPLYAFTSEGVWALEVSATGTYSAKQPITRDVVINPDSITQIDSAVLFATDRGIMHISGSTVQCISDRLNTEELFSIADLPKCDKLINIFNGKADESEQVTLADITLLPFNEFLQGCRMVYDYTNQHLIVYNPAVRYAYVYSLKSQTWGMMRSDIVDNVNSYPEALAMADGAKLVDFSKPVAENITALIITRPFKIDDPNMFKTINTIIQRGMFRSTHVQQVLYGSNDLIHWHTVWSSVDKIMRGFRGTPYKAFRLALVCKFDRGESIYGCTVVYEPRMTNQVR